MHCELRIKTDFNIYSFTLTEAANKNRKTRFVEEHRGFYRLFNASSFYMHVP